MTGQEENSGSLEQPVVCVFCASTPGNDPAHLESARVLAKSLHDAGYRLVYGGGTMGIMGEVAKTFVSLGGPSTVEGIIPRALIRTEKDPATKNEASDEPGDTKQAEKSMTRAELQRLDSSNESENFVIPVSEFGKTTVVKDMHTRKRLMAEKVANGGPGSGFVSLAGGYGTMEEVMEMVTWNQLGIHKIPIVLVNINGYWDGVVNWVKNSVAEGFVGKGNANILVEVKDPADVPDALKNYKVAEGRFKLDWAR